MDYTVMLPTNKRKKEEVEMTFVCMSAVADMNKMRLSYHEFELSDVIKYQYFYAKQKSHSALITLSPYSAIHEAEKNMKIGKMYNYLVDGGTENTKLQHDKLQENQLIFPTVMQQKNAKVEEVYYDYFDRLFVLAKQKEVMHLVLDISKYRIVDAQRFAKEVFQVVKAFKNDFESITFALDEPVQNTQRYLALKSELNLFVFKD